LAGSSSRRGLARRLTTPWPRYVGVPPPGGSMYNCPSRLTCSVHSLPVQ
jgi:hypothetical protein